MVWASLSILSDYFCSERSGMATATVTAMVRVKVMVKVTVMEFKKMIHRIPRSQARKKAKG